MLVSSSGSYYEQFKRTRGVKPGDLENQRLLTDRAAYLSFLEVQLERVSAACLSTQGFGDRIDQVQGEVYGVEEKLVNLTHLIKLSQAYYDRQYEQMGQLASHTREQVATLAEAVGKGETEVRVAREDARMFGEKAEDQIRGQSRVLEVTRTRVDESMALMGTKHAALVARHEELASSCEDTSSRVVAQAERAREMEDTLRNDLKRQLTREIAQVRAVTEEVREEAAAGMAGLRQGREASLEVIEGKIRATAEASTAALREHLGRLEAVVADLGGERKLRMDLEGRIEVGLEEAREAISRERHEREGTLAAAMERIDVTCQRSAADAARHAEERAAKILEAFEVVDGRMTALEADASEIRREVRDESQTHRADLVGRLDEHQERHDRLEERAAAGDRGASARAESDVALRAELGAMAERVAAWERDLKATVGQTIEAHTMGSAQAKALAGTLAGALAGSLALARAARGRRAQQADAGTSDPAAMHGKGQGEAGEDKAEEMVAGGRAPSLHGPRTGPEEAHDAGAPVEMLRAELETVSKGGCDALAARLERLERAMAAPHVAAEREAQHEQRYAAQQKKLDTALGRVDELVAVLQATLSPLRGEMDALSQRQRQIEAALAAVGIELHHGPDGSIVFRQSEQEEQEEGVAPGAMSATQRDLGDMTDGAASPGRGGDVDADDGEEGDTMDETPERTRGVDLTGLASRHMQELAPLREALRELDHLSTNLKGRRRGSSTLTDAATLRVAQRLGRGGGASGSDGGTSGVSAADRRADETRMHRRRAAREHRGSGSLATPTAPSRTAAEESGMESATSVTSGTEATRGRRARRKAGRSASLTSPQQRRRPRRRDATRREGLHHRKGRPWSEGSGDGAYDTYDDAASGEGAAWRGRRRHRARSGRGTRSSPSRSGSAEGAEKREQLRQLYQQLVALEKGGAQ